MKFLRQLLDWVFKPYLAVLRQEQAEASERLRRAMQQELQRVGLSIMEIQSRVAALQLAHVESQSQIDLLMRTLTTLTEPVKPGNHVRPGHEFGNRVQL